jgi:hypothetical protein
MRALAVCLLLLLLSVSPAGTGAAQEPPPDEETAEELEEFVPSEEIRADSAVSFPVDI